MNVVDSSGWLEYIADTDRSKLFAGPIEDQANLIVPVISVYEVFKTLHRQRGEDNALQAVGIMMLGEVIDIDLDVALEAAHYKMPLADSLIYATAQRHNALLWTQDSDFGGLPDVRYFPK